jgi:hypothetical protein
LGVAEKRQYERFRYEKGRRRCIRVYLEGSFSQLVSLSKKITDYAMEDETMVDPDMEQRDAEIDEEVGVAAVFDEEEQEEEDDEAFEMKE